MEFKSKKSGDYKVTYEGIAVYTGRQYDIMEGRGNSPDEAMEDLRSHSVYWNTYTDDVMKYYIGKKEVSRDEFYLYA